MPNQRSKDKTMVGGYVLRSLAEVADEIARRRDCRTRAELIENLIREAAMVEGLKVPAPAPRYSIDKLRADERK